MMGGYGIGDKVIAADMEATIINIATDGKSYEVIMGGYGKAWFSEEDLIPAQSAGPQPDTLPSEGDVPGISPDVLAAGIAELRRYVEGNGFKWCEDEDAVFNVTTALGLMGGTIEVLQAENAAAHARIAALSEALEPFAYEWEMFRNYATEQGGRADVGNYVTNYRDLDIIMNACERAFKALQTAQQAASENGDVRK